MYNRYAHIYAQCKHFHIKPILTNVVVYCISQVCRDAHAYGTSVHDLGKCYICQQMVLATADCRATDVYIHMYTC